MTLGGIPDLSRPVTTPLKYEKAVENLEAIVRKLEEGNLELDESLKAFEEGVQLSRLCEKQLSEAKGKIEKLVQKENGTLAEEPFEDS